jgi:hypothetical protein
MGLWLPPMFDHPRTRVPCFETMPPVRNNNGPSRAIHLQTYERWTEYAQRRKQTDLSYAAYHKACLEAGPRCPEAVLKKAKQREREYERRKKVRKTTEPMQNAAETLTEAQEQRQEAASMDRKFIDLLVFSAVYKKTC